MKSYLRPSPIALLHHFGESPFARVAAFEDILHHHRRGESRGYVEDFEVAVCVKDFGFRQSMMLCGRVRLHRE